MRLPFLILTPACVFLGYSVALHNGFLVNYYHLFLAGFDALAAHAAVNILNEYADSLQVFQLLVHSGIMTTQTN